MISLAIPYFSTLSHYLFDFRKNFTEHKVFVLIFSTTCVWKISYSKKNSARYDHICTFIFMNSTCSSCGISMKLEFYRQIYENYSNIKFHENPFSGSRVIPCGEPDKGHTDRQTCQANSRFSQLCERVLKQHNTTQHNTTHTVAIRTEVLIWQVRYRLQSN